MISLCASPADIFKDTATAIVIPTNCEGVMGAGLALRAARKYLGIEAAYRSACKRGEVAIGTIFPYTPTPAADLATITPAYVFCLPTKDEWRNPSTLTYVEEGLDALINISKAYGISSLAVPALGCGLGGLAWADVRHLMVSKLADLSRLLDVRIYEPSKG